MNSKTLIKTFIVSLLLVSTTASPLEIFDPWVQGGLIRGRVDPGHKLQFLGRQVRTDAAGNFVLGLGRDARAEASLIETAASGQQIRHSFAVKQRQYNEQRIEGVPKRTVQVPEEALTRIRQEVKITKAARATDSPRLDFLQSFDWPTQGIITGIYGSRRVYNGQPGRPHYGIDIAAPQGSPVYAPVAGKVSLVHDNMYFSGGTLIMDHGHGVSSTFIHLHKILVKVGDVIQKGGLIAEIGSTGRSTGPHLDWRVNWFDQRLDPQLLVKGLPERHPSQ